MCRVLSAIAAAVATICIPALGSSDLLFEGAELQINAYTTDDQVGTAARCVARSSDGSFVVVWHSFDGDGEGVRGRRFDAGGAPDGTEFQVNTYSTEKLTCLPRL